jgi:hypothetical protein
LRVARYLPASAAATTGQMILGGGATGTGAARFENLNVGP